LTPLGTTASVAHRGFDESAYTRWSIDSALPLAEVRTLREMRASSVEFRSVEKLFGGVQVLSEFSLSIPEGAFLVVLGPSGCGKTTALRILAGLEQPSGGRVLIGDDDVTDLPPRRRNVAMVFQSYALYPHMNVEENIAYPLKIRGVPKGERHAAVVQVAELVGIGHLLDRRPRQLSGGQRQRVALARAMVREPSCFLMDEPLSNLDAKLRTSMRGELKRLQKELGTTTLYVTHDQAEATTMADLVAVIDNGVLQQVASPDEIYDRPTNRFVATFVGNPALSIVRGWVDRNAGCFVSDLGSIPVSDRTLSASADAPVEEMGVRPEDLRLTSPDEEGVLKGEVYVVEPMGHETIVDVRAGDVHLAVLAPRDWRGASGESVGIRVNDRTACFFDGKGTTTIHRSDRSVPADQEGVAI
jgi:multiple sugar transport system ATP-binding protein